MLLQESELGDMCGYKEIETQSLSPGACSLVSKREDTQAKLPMTEVRPQPKNRVSQEQSRENN